MSEPLPLRHPQTHPAITPAQMHPRATVPGQALDQQLRQVQNRASGTGLLRPPVAAPRRNQCTPTPDEAAWGAPVGRTGDSLAAPTSFSPTPFDLRKPFAGDPAFQTFAEGLLDTFVATAHRSPADPAAARTTLQDLVNSWIGKKIGHAHRDDQLVHALGKDILGKKYWKADIGLERPGGAPTTVMEHYFDSTQLPSSLRSGITKALGEEWAAPERLEAASEKMTETFSAMSQQSELFTGKNPEATRERWDSQREAVLKSALAQLKQAAALWPGRKSNLEKGIKSLLHTYLGGNVDAAARGNLATLVGGLMRDIDSALTAPPQKAATLARIQSGVLAAEPIYAAWVLENHTLTESLKLGAARSAREYVQRDAWNTGCSVPVPPKPADAAADPLQPIPWEVQNWAALEPRLKELVAAFNRRRVAVWKGEERKIDAAWVKNNPVGRGEKRPPRPASAPAPILTEVQVGLARAALPLLMDSSPTVKKESIVGLLKILFAQRDTKEGELLSDYADSMLKGDSGRKNATAQVHGATARFLKALHLAWRSTSKISFGGGSYDGHGSGDLKGQGYSVDIMLHGGQDSRGFYDPALAVLFIKTMLEVARKENFHLWVLYNDATVAAVVNKAEGRQVVHFTILHGPAPFVLHFHVDLTPMARP